MRVNRNQFNNIIVTITILCSLGLSACGGGGPGGESTYNIFNKTFGGGNRDCAAAVQQTSDGGYILAGYTESFGAGGYDFWLIRTDAEGNAPATPTP
jgi:hypothetical protein